MSNSGPQFVSDDLKQWCEYLRNKETESPVYHPRANRLAEGAIQRVKGAFKAWSPNLNMPFRGFVWTHRNTSKTRDEASVELLLGRRCRLEPVAGVPFVRSLSIQGLGKDKDSSLNFDQRKGLNKFFI